MPWVRTHSRTQIYPTRTHVSTRTHWPQTERATPRTRDTANAAAAILADSTNDNSERSRFFAVAPDETDDALNGFIGDVTTIVQSQCERATDYADIEMLVSRLPIDHCTFAAHDSSAPYSGPYPMALLVRAFLIEEINGWDETALHDHLRANPSLLRRLGFKTLPNQSTFWRAWNHRFSEALRDAVQECVVLV